MWHKTTYEQTISISQTTADIIAEYLSNKQHQPEDDTYSVTATFPDGKQMDIKCCGVQDEDEGSWTEAVLFDNNGAELCCTEVEEEFLGTWELECYGVLYRAIVTVA